MTWERRLPEGAEYASRTASGFTLKVSMPSGEDRLLPLACPKNPAHRFKVEVNQAPAGEGPSDVHCVYCGHTAPVHEFMRDQMPRIEAAATAAAEQLAEAGVAKMLRKFQGVTGVTVSRTHAPRRRTLPTYEVSPTRRQMTCNRCQATFAVYDLAYYCPECGVLAPAQQLAELVRVHRERLDAVDALPAAERQRLTDAGVLTVNHEATVKDGFGALETYLKDRFAADAPASAPKVPSTTFQRLDETAGLYRDHLGVDLPAAVGEGTREALKRSASLRHVLTHSSGKIDQKFLDRNPGWPQRLGERCVVRREQADAFLDTLARFATAVLTPPAL